MRGDSPHTAVFGAPLVAAVVAVLTVGLVAPGVLDAPFVGAATAVLALGTVATASPTGPLTAPADGRLRGPDFSAQVTGVAWPASVLSGGLTRVAGTGRRLVVFAVRVSQPPEDVGPLTHAATATATLDVGHAQLAVDLSAVDQQIEGAGLSTLTGTGEGTFAASVPARTHDVVLSVAEGSFAQRFGLWTLRRLSPAPAVLYRSPTSATLTDTADQSASLPITNPADGYADPATLELTTATLTDFAPGSNTTPATPTDAYLVVDLAARRPTVPTPNDPGWGHFFSTLAPLPGNRLTFTPAGGPPVTATTAPLTTTTGRGSGDDGLFAQRYWFTAPASLTSGTLSVTAGPDIGTEYVGFQGTQDTVPLTIPSAVTLSVAFPGPAAPAHQSVPPWVGKPLPPTGSGAAATATTTAGAPAEASGGFPVWLAVLVVVLLAAASVAGERTVRRHRSRSQSRESITQPGGEQDPAETQPAPVEPVVPTPTAPAVVPTATTAPTVAPPTPPTAPPIAPTATSDDHPDASPVGGRLGDDGDLVVRVLGPVEITGWRTPPEHRGVVEELCCFLAMHTGRAFATAELIAALWPLDGERGDVTPKTVHNHLSSLRRHAGTEHLPDAVTAGGYRLTEAVTDWGEFSRLVAEADGATGDEAHRLRGQALDLVRGVPFADVPVSGYPWVFAESLATTMTIAIAGCAHELATGRLAAGDPRGAEEAARRGLLGAPDDEFLWRDVVVAARASGDRGALRRAWRDLTAALGADRAAALRDETDT